METINVRNAGVVLLNSYIPMLFERLGLTVDKQFTTKENRLAAVHYLQYLVTGMTYTDEYLLPLNKVLCGLAPQETADIAVNINGEQTNLMEELLKAVINYWPEIGASSLDGFRGNWLIRDGILRETKDRWELTVEKRAYDILINKSPFSFSIIMYPWMTKPMHVIWI